MSVGRGTDPARPAQLLDARPITGSLASGIGALPDMALGVGASGLSLVDVHGRQLRRWEWADVESVGTGDVAPDGDGVVRQTLTVQTRSGPLVVLADARQLPHFLSALSAERAAARVAVERRQRRARMRRVVAAAASVALVAGLAGVSWVQLRRPGADGAAKSAAHRPFASALGAPVVHLTEATAPPAPAPASLAVAPLATHEAFGFLPYWALEDPTDVDLASLTTVAYFSLDVTAAGTVDESPTDAGWVGYQSQALADLVTEAHRDGARAVLTATCFDQATLNALTSDPAAQATLATTLVTLVRAKNLDGVNLDFEGTGPTDRSGLDHLVATVSQALYSADPSWQFTVDTYASSASDGGGFYDIAGMAPYVDAFVVMDYDMGDTYASGPTDGSVYNDQTVVSSYSAVAGASKVILGMPLYGEEWPTTGPTAGDPATGPATAVADDQIASTDAVYWDPTTDGPWAVSRVGKQWYQVWFDDPASLAAKERLAEGAGLRGEAVWALGMADGTDDQEAAFTGVAAVPQPPVGPVSASGGTLPGPLAPTGVVPLLGTGNRATTGSAPAAAAFGSGGSAGAATGETPAASGSYDGTSVSLVPWSGSVPAATTPAGSLSAFSSPGTSVACLASGPSLAVVQIDGTSAFVVEASAETDCAAGTWAFVLQPASREVTGGGGSTTDGGAPSGAGGSSSPNGAGATTSTGTNTATTTTTTTTTTTGTPAGSATTTDSGATDSPPSSG